VQRAGAFECWEAGEICLWCGDFFALTPADLSTCAAVYDRASLIALPPAMRQDYARHLQAILPPATGILLVTLEYPQERIGGPPFAVDESEVQALYGARYGVERLYVHVDAVQNPRFPEAGVTHWTEKVYLLKPRADTAADAGS
jgi:thiopurine S-methyltransferase